MKKEFIDLGTFEVVSGVLRISDPCYDKKTWCAGTVKNVLNGTWKAQVKKVDMEDNWGNRCRKLMAVHESFNKADVMVERLNIDVGVDSGQAGIFDDKFYQVTYDEDHLQTGRLEYYHENDLYRAKDSIALYEAKLLIAKDELTKALYQDQIDYYKSDKFKTIDYSKAEPTKDWYEICCDRTLSKIGAGVIRNGVVSSSGDGDGSYSAYAAYNKDGKVVGVKILF